VSKRREIRDKTNEIETKKKKKPYNQ
jgi:hypothetical protein